MARMRLLVFISLYQNLNAPSDRGDMPGRQQIVPCYRRISVCEWEKINNCEESEKQNLNE